MLFQATISIPKSTTQANPEEVTLKIARGIITKFMVRPAPGHVRLAHLVILHHGHQIAPSTESMSLQGDTFPLDWEDYYESYQPPYELKIKGWNDDDTYPHSFDVYVAVLPRKAIIAYQIIDAIKKMLEEMVGALSPKRIFTSKGD